MMKAMTLIMIPIKSSLKMKLMAKKVKKKKKKMSKIGMMKRMCCPLSLPEPANGRKVTP